MNKLTLKPGDANIRDADEKKMEKRVAQTVKKLPSMQETWVWFLGWEDSLKKGMVSYSSNTCVSHRVHVWLSATPWTVAPPVSYVHGILQARILDWLAIPTDSVYAAHGWFSGRILAYHTGLIPSRCSHSFPFGASLIAQLIESTCNAGDPSLIPGLERSPGEGNGHQLQYSDLENPILYSPWGLKDSDMTEQPSLSLSPFTFLVCDCSRIKMDSIWAKSSKDHKEPKQNVNIFFVKLFLFL